jgi:hypothetical protein
MVAYTVFVLTQPTQDVTYHTNSSKYGVCFVILTVASNYILCTHNPVTKSQTEKIQNCDFQLFQISIFFFWQLMTDYYQQTPPLVEAVLPATCARNTLLAYNVAS